MKNLLEDKKGFLPLIPLAVGLVILIGGIFAIISFIASAKLRFILIGVAILLAVVMLFGKSLSSTRRSTKGERGVLLLLALVGVFFIFGNGILQQTFSGDVFVKPQFARLECAPTDSFEGKDIKWLDQRRVFLCNANTEECRFTVDLTNKVISPSVSYDYKVCDLSGNGCSGRITGTYLILTNPKQVAQFNVPNGKSVVFGDYEG